MATLTDLYRQAREDAWPNYAAFKADCMAYLQARFPGKDMSHELMFKLAWNEGHSNGYHAVLSCLENLLLVVGDALSLQSAKVERIKKILKEAIRDGHDLSGDSHGFRDGLRVSLRIVMEEFPDV